MKKTFLHFCVSLCSSVALIILLSSCGPPNEKAHPAFQKGEKLKDNGEYKEAAENFEKYLTFNYNSSMTHMKLAELYYDNLDDPFLAAFHFKQYLKIEPNSSDRETITSWIESAEQRMAKKIQERNPDYLSMDKIKELQNHNTEYRKLLVKLKNKNAVLRKKLNRGSRSSVSEKKNGKNSSDYDVDSISKDASGEFVILRMYKVKSGDSLSRISREVYGSSQYYKFIFDANRDMLETEAKLNVGQELRIPQLKTKKEQKKEMIDTPEEEEFPGVITD